MLSNQIELLKLLATGLTLATGLIGILFAKKRKDGRLTRWGHALIGLLLLSITGAVVSQWIGYQRKQAAAAKAAQQEQELNRKLDASLIENQRLRTQFNAYDFKLSLRGEMPLDSAVFGALTADWLDLLTVQLQETRRCGESQITLGSGRRPIGNGCTAVTELQLVRGDRGFPTPTKAGEAAVLLDRMNVRLSIYKEPLPAAVLRDPTALAARLPDFQAFFPGPDLEPIKRGARGLGISLGTGPAQLAETVRLQVAGLGATPLGGNKIDSQRDLLGAQMVIRIDGYVPDNAPVEVRKAIEAAWNSMEISRLDLFTGRRQMTLLASKGLHSLVDDRGRRLHLFHLIEDLDTFLPELASP